MTTSLHRRIRPSHDPYAFFACTTPAPDGPFELDSDAYCPECSWHWNSHNDADRAQGRIDARLAHHPSA